MTTEELRKAFARRLSLPMLFDVNQLKKTILNGIRTQVWIYYDARSEMAYDRDAPPPAVQITDEAYLYLPEEAAKLDLPIKGKVKSTEVEEETCPVCGKPVSQCTCADDIGGTLPPGSPEPLRGEGVPQQAFQHLSDLCHDQQIIQLTELRITLQGQGKAGAQNVRLLSVAIPQLNAREVRVRLNCAAEFGPDETLTVNLSAAWERYRQLKQATDELAKAASAFNATLTLSLRFPDGLAVDSDEFRTIHEVLTTMGLGVILLEAVAATTSAAATASAAA